MNVKDFQGDFEKVVEFLKQDISGLRTGRATTAMVDSITVEAYGTKQPLKAVASITISDAKSLAIDPWDKSQLGAIEKSIRDSGLGINPVNDGRLIRLVLPDLTSERRQELLKILNQKLEQARISVRKVREEVRGLIEAEEKEGGMSEDDKFRAFEDLEKLVKEFNDKIKEVGDNKEREINTV
jgi:ribosome recycling factor